MLRQGKYEDLREKLDAEIALTQGDKRSALKDMKRMLDNFLAEGRDGPEERAKIEEKRKKADEERQRAQEEERKREQERVLAEQEKERSKTRPRIIALGGFNHGWHAAWSSTSPYASQSYIFSSDFPLNLIEKSWNNDYRITSIAGGSKRWAVILSRYKDDRRPKQRIIGPAVFDDEFLTDIKEGWAEELRVTGIAGFDQTWVVVMTEVKGWGRQGIIPPGEIDQAKIAELVKDGKVITSASGDVIDSKNGKKIESYAFVFTSQTGYHHPAWWLRTNARDFASWTDDLRDTHAPTALFGWRGSIGGFFCEGTPLGENWGYMFSAPEDKLVQKLKELEITK